MVKGGSMIDPKRIVVCYRSCGCIRWYRDSGQCSDCEHELSYVYALEYRYVDTATGMSEVDATHT